MKHKLSTLPAGGLYLGMEEDGKQCYFNEEDTHVLTIGATRCGKTRCVVLESIVLLAFAEESIVATDPKAELYLYTAPFLARMGYEVIALDFKNPRKSTRYNFLQPVINAVREKDIPKAVECARDLVSSLVTQGDMERIWTDGERSTIAAGVLCVVYDNQDHPEYQNLTNVYYFLARMCQPVAGTGQMPLTPYLAQLPPDHPARAVLDIAQIAPEKMRGSFYTSALVTLSLFTDPGIYSMTNTTDFDVHGTGRDKRAVFIILPDHKDTYYSIASLFVYQHYQTLVEDSDANGNRLERRVNFICDEFGNFTKIPNFDKLVTVGGGRGVRFNLFLQDFNQLDETYGEKVGKTIRSNCETWVYLQTDDSSTLRELSEKIGKYTVKSPSLSGSTGGNMSASYNLTGRELLMPDEIKKITRPYLLVTSRSDPAILYAPDLSATPFNRLLGLGGREHNQAVIRKRQQARPERPPLAMRDIRLWGIWTQYERMLSFSAETPKTIRFD